MRSYLLRARMGEMYFLIIFGAFGPFASAWILIRKQSGKEETKKWRKKNTRNTKAYSMESYRRTGHSHISCNTSYRIL
jgi:hypothetical protein